MKSLPVYRSSSETQQSCSVDIRQARATDSDGGEFTDILQYEVTLNMMILVKVKVTPWDAYANTEALRAIGKEYQSGRLTPVKARYPLY